MFVSEADNSLEEYIALLSWEGGRCPLVYFLPYFIPFFVFFFCAVISLDRGFRKDVFFFFFPLSFSFSSAARHGVCLRTETKSVNNTFASEIRASNKWEPCQGQHVVSKTRRVRMMCCTVFCREGAGNTSRSGGSWPGVWCAAGGSPTSPHPSSAAPAIGAQLLAAQVSGSGYTFLSCIQSPTGSFPPVEFPRAGICMWAFPCRT